MLRPLWSYLLLAVLIVSPALAQRSGRAQLPPPPDSLRALLQAAPTDAARAAALLRIAWSFEDVSAPDSVGMFAYAAAAEAIGRQLGDSAVVGEADDVHGAYWLDQLDDAHAEPLLRRARARLTNAPPAVRACNLHHLAYLYEDKNQNAQAIACHRQAIELYRQARLLGRQAQLLMEMGSDYQRENNLDSAVSCLFRALRLSRRVRNRAQEASVLSNIGSVYSMRRDYPASNRYARATYRLALAIGDTSTMISALEGLSVNAYDVDSTAQSLRYLRILANLTRLLPTYEHEADILGHFGAAFQKAGQIDSATHYYQRAVTLSEQQHGSTWVRGLFMTHLGELRRLQGDPAEATQWAQQALALDSSQADHAYFSSALALLRQIAVDRHDYPAAYALLVREQAVAAHREKRQHTRLMEEVRAGYEVEEAEQQVRLLTEQRTVTRLRQQRTMAGLSTLALLAVAGAGLGARAYRRRQLRREAGLRTKLAADLHDDVGALLTQITLETSLLQVTSANQPELLLARLERLTEISRRAKQQMADVVWSIDARRDSMDELLTRMREYAFETLPAVGIDFDFLAAPELASLSLPLEARQHLYLIYKEALHNVMKHAHATVVTVRLTREPHALVLHLTDNGHGYAGVGRPGGQGLTNMRTRAEASGGTLTYDAPVPGQGFGLLLHLPV